MMYGDENDLEAKRMMLEKMRDFGSSRMLEGLKKKPDLSITIAAGPGKPGAGMDEENGEPPHVGMEGAQEEVGEPAHAQDDRSAMFEQLRLQGEKDKAKAARKFMNIKAPFAR